MLPNLRDTAHSAGPDCGGRCGRSRRSYTSPRGRPGPSVGGSRTAPCRRPPARHPTTKGPSNTSWRATSKDSGRRRSPTPASSRCSSAGRSERRSRRWKRGSPPTPGPTGRRALRHAGRAVSGRGHAGAAAPARDVGQRRAGYFDRSRVVPDAWDRLGDEAVRLQAFLADRDPATYRRYRHWWDKLPAGDTRVLAA